MTAQLCLSVVEGDFAASSYSLQDRSANGGTAVVTAQTGGGNPGGYLEISTDAPGAATRAEVLVLLPALVYTLSVTGPIEGVAFKFHLRTFGGGAVSQYHEAALVQNGTLYRIPNMGTYVGDVWDGGRQI